MAVEARREAQGWLRKAEDDLRGAQVDLDAVPPLIEDALFHSQQAAEAEVRGVVSRVTATLPRTVSERGSRGTPRKRRAETARRTLGPRTGAVRAY